jgi:hypothetical protein
MSRRRHAILREIAREIDRYTDAERLLGVLATRAAQLCDAATFDRHYTEAANMELQLIGLRDDAADFSPPARRRPTTNHFYPEVIHVRRPPPQPKK